jgi:hypothetical protein
MRSIFNPADVASLQARLHSITATTPGLWGRMNAPQMICHVRDQMRCAIGELPAKRRKNILSNKLLRHVVVFMMPWPKGKLPTSPEMQTSQPTDWDEDLSITSDTLRRAAAADPDAEWAEHPVFGRLSGREWGRLIYKHTDHHLRQFGV